MAGANVDEKRKLRAIFCAKGYRDFAESDASAPSVQLRIIRLRLAVISYRKWDFSAMDASRALLRSEPLERDTYVKLPQVLGKDNISQKLLEPLYCLSTAREDWYKTIRNFLAN